MIFRALFALLLVLTMLRTAEAEEGLYLVSGVPVPGELAVRSEPDDSSRKVATLGNSNFVTLQNCRQTSTSDVSRSTWCEVDGARSGWARRSSFQQENARETYVVVGRAGGFGESVRSVPSNDGLELFELPSGVGGVLLYGCMQSEGVEWCRISTPGVRGWVNARYLRHWTGEKRGQPVGQDENTLVAEVDYVGCPVFGHADEEPRAAPTRHSIKLRVEKVNAARLAVYQAAFGPAIIGPRGWHCFARFGSSGYFLEVRPEPFDRRGESTGGALNGDDRAITLKLFDGGTSGRYEVAQIIARMFPAYRKFAETVRDMNAVPRSEFVFAQFPKDNLIRWSDSVVVFETPSNFEGIGTWEGLPMGSESIGGIVVLVGSPNEPSVRVVRARLGDRDQDLLPEINRFAATATVGFGDVFSVVSERESVDWQLLLGDWAHDGKCDQVRRRYNAEGVSEYLEKNSDGSWRSENSDVLSLFEVYANRSEVCSFVPATEEGGCSSVVKVTETEFSGTTIAAPDEEEEVKAPESFVMHRCDELTSPSTGMKSREEQDRGAGSGIVPDSVSPANDPRNQDSKLLKLPVLGWWPFIVGLVVSTLVALRKGTGNFSRAVAVFFAVGISIILAYFLVPDFGRSADLHGGLRTLLAYCGAGALAFYALLTMLDGSGPADPSTLAGRELLPLDAVDPAYFVQHLAAKHVVSQRFAARNTTVQSVRRDYYPFRQAGGTLEVEYFGEIQVRLQYLPKGVIPRRVNGDMAHVYVEGSLSVTFVTWVCTLKRQAEEKPERGARVAPRFYLRGELGTEPHFLPEMGKEAFKAVFKAQMDNAIQSEIRKKVLPPYASPDLSYIRVRIGEWIEVRDEEEIYAPFHRIDYKFRGRRRVSFACADGKNLVTGVQTTSEARKSVAKIVLTANRESGLF
jgi:hypothetical protein